MNHTELITAFLNYKTIKHTNGNQYVIVCSGEMKEQGVWKPSFTYRCLVSAKTYTRASDNFKNFSLNK